MKKTTLTVFSPVGVFRRQTARTYTHLVVANGYRSELLEQERLGSIAYYRKLAKAYRAGKGVDGRPAMSSQEQLSTWADQYEADAAKLAALEPITADQVTEAYGVLGWAGRLDLARKLATSTQAGRYRSVHILDVATGQEVR